MLAHAKSVPAWLESVDRDRNEQAIIDELVDMIFPLSILDESTTLEQYMSTATLSGGLNNSEKL